MRTLKRRIDALERSVGASDPLIVILDAFAKGSSRLPKSAIFLDGRNAGLRLDRQSGETGKAFLKRVDKIARQ